MVETPNASWLQLQPSPIFNDFSKCDNVLSSFGGSAVHRSQASTFNNVFTPECFAVVSENLRRMTFLKVLLYAMHMALRLSMTFNSSVTHFSLNCNMFGNEGAIAVAQALHALPHLQQFKYAHMSLFTPPHTAAQAHTFPFLWSIALVLLMKVSHRTLCTTLERLP